MPLADGGGAVSGVLDAAALDGLRELDPSGQTRLVERVLKTYQSASARLLAQLHDARRDCNLKGIHYVAHTLKSSSASIGATRLAALCARAESMAGTQTTDGLGAQLESLVAELDGVLKTIAQLLDGMQ